MSRGDGVRIAVRYESADDPLVRKAK